MLVLSKPVAYIKGKFDRDVTLVYGDIVDGEITLFSNDNLQGYEKDGSLYRKQVKGGLTDGDRISLTDCRAYPVPREEEVMRPPDFSPEKELVTKPTDEEVALFGVKGSYAFVHSEELFKRLEEEGYKHRKEKNPFYFKIPDDVTLVHEGTHLAIHSEQNRIFPGFIHLVDDRFDPNEVLEEAIPIFCERDYTSKTIPDKLSVLNHQRSHDADPMYREANRISLQEKSAVEEMIEMSKE